MRYLLSFFIFLTSNCVAHLGHSVDLKELSIQKLHQKVDQGELTYQQVTRFYLTEINKMNQQGLKLNAVISVNPDAISIAKQRDQQAALGVSLGALHGVPILLKDNIETADKMPTTAGSLALYKNFATKDAPLVKQLKQAGAIILGKASLSEWANFRSSISSSGWNSITGQAKKPYILTRSPCGSSSGSAISTSANMTLLAIGTETDGSITCPAAHNSLVGFKPTLGLISTTGIIPLSHSQDVPGPMTRTVSDAAIMLNILAKPETPKIDYVKSLKPQGLSGKRIGIIRNISDFNTQASFAFNKALKQIEAQGATLIDGLQLSQIHEAHIAELEVLLYEFKHDINQYLAQTPNSVKVKSLEQLIAFNKTNTQNMALFDQHMLEMAQQKGALTNHKYLKAKQVIQDKVINNGLASLIKKYNLDAFAAPSNSPAWKIDLINGDHFGGSSSGAAAMAGFPSITVPMAFYKELPLGISFFSDSNSERKLIEIAYGFEQATKVRQAPKFIHQL